MGFVRVASLSELPDDGVLGVEAEGKKICLARCDGEIYALADNCTHRDFPLSLGELDADDCTVTCEWHGANFDVRTGAALCLPATRPVAVYEVKLEAEDIYVNVG